MSTKPTEILMDLTKSSKMTRKSGRGKGRFVRTPNYTKPITKSTRPRTDSGVTFHFAHKTISKRNDISDSAGSSTSASSHQGYIERKEAGAVGEEEFEKAFENHINEYPDEGKYPERQEGEELSEEDFQPAKMNRTKDRIGFGTIGEIPAQRREFWNRVERAEGRHGRVQTRIIAELPHEATNEERSKIALEFCEELRSRNLPFWAAIHAPTKKNDRRNHHLHIAYYERPSRISEDGTWDFEHEKTVKNKNRTKRIVKPYKQSKSQEVRARGWVKQLRQGYADANNKVLEEGGYEKRLDPRSYKESGVLKEPTRHLGFKANAMENFGLETEVGQENSKKEYRWKVSEKTRKWDRAIAHEEVVGLFEMDTIDEGFFSEADKRRQQLLKGRTHAVTGLRAQLMSEQMSIRFEKRKSFLEQEGQRLLKNGRGVLIESLSQDLTSIDEEQIVMSTREDDVMTVAKNLQLLARKEERSENNIWNLYVAQQETETEKSSENFLNVLEDDDVFVSWGLPENTPQETENLISTNESEEEDLSGFFSEEIEVPSDKEETKTPSLEEQKIAQDFFEDDEDFSDFENVQSDKKEEDKKQDVVVPCDTSEEAINKEKETAEDSNKLNGIFFVERPNTREDIKELDTKLRAMNNKQVRLMAIGTRDVVDFIEPGEQRDSANRGWVVLKQEAMRRGVDLETGKQDIKKATDKERAELHRDQYLESVLMVRQEVIRIQGR